MCVRSRKQLRIDYGGDLLLSVCFAFFALCHVCSSGNDSKRESPTHTLQAEICSYTYFIVNLLIMNRTQLEGGMVNDMLYTE